VTLARTAARRRSRRRPLCVYEAPSFGALSLTKPVGPTDLGPAASAANYGPRPSANTTAPKECRPDRSRWL